MRYLLLAVLAVLPGCTLLGGVTGLVTGPVDCTIVHVETSGPAGLILFPLTPFEGAYQGARMGWYTDKAVVNGREGIKPMAFIMPCRATAVIQAWGGLR